ncbi:MAG: tryptophan 7-halogenase [Chloroflexi bacterium]|nr:tryptophan 7-halogenase [Chloroflexota bacterium]
MPDVIVIGGGPAGSTAATMLARKGWQVALLERERFPRAHIGESLLPASMPVLDMLGVLPAVQEAGFLRKWGATMVWGTETEPWSWYFRETNQRHPHAYQVWRPQFDQLLLENSRANGADVREGSRVLEVLFEGGRATGVRFEDGAGERELRARFIVDASGQAGLIARGRKLRKLDDAFRNLAIYGYFAGAYKLPPPDATNILIESYEHGWFWVIPLHTGWTSVGAVVDSRLGQEGIAALGREAYLREQIALAGHTSNLLREAQLRDGPHVLRDWSYASTEMVGDGYVLAGDAACFIDPLFSSGVHLALSAGVLAAAYVTTALKHPEMADAARQAYSETYSRQYSHFRELAKLFYSSNKSRDSYFWEARRILGDPGDASPREAFVRAVAGQPPQGYERVVIERGDAPPEYVEGVRAIESGRERRQARFQASLASGALAAAVPALVTGAVLDRRAVIGDGEFELSDVLVTPQRPEGIPLSALIARFAGLIDGRQTVDELLRALLAAVPAERAEEAARATVTALSLLYAEGAVSGLAEHSGEGWR